MRLYNSLSKTVEEFKPLVPGEISVYCCGPTVYDYQHIGNMRTYIFEDLLVKTLRRAGYSVKHVMNVTDVGHLVSDADEGEDKMVLAAKREKKSSKEIAEYYTKVFFDDCAKLNIARPDIVCKATEHIECMIGLIKRLEERGMTYTAGGNVYFDVGKLPDYGKLARLDLDKLKAGARIEVDANKKSPFDFVLWFTRSKFEGQELQWDSPWGKGYPGWHIECSAMSMKYLGDRFDIHCGGIDHIPVHHTNEIAQAEGATGEKWVNVWMHGEFLVTDKEKMSKSKGGFLTLDTLIERGFDPVAYRLFCLGGHYRSQLAFSWEALQNAQNSLNRLKGMVLSLKKEAGKGEPATPPEDSGYLTEFENAVFNDLNAPKAMAVLWGAAGDRDLSPEQKLSLLLSFDEILGLGISGWKEEETAIPEDVMKLVKEREAARRDKNWSESDRLRDEIKALGFSVEDSPEGPKVKAQVS